MTHVQRMYAGVAVSLVLASGLGLRGQGNPSQTPAQNIDALLQNARTQGDTKAVSRLTNLKFALGKLKPSDLKSIKCGKEPNVSPIDFVVDNGQDVAGKLLDKILSKYLPTLAAALASTTAAAVTAFLTPAEIGPDSVEILNQNTSRPRAEVQRAARQMLQDTLEANFKNLPTPMMAKIVACSI